MRFLPDGRIDRSEWRLESLRGEDAFVSVIVAVELADALDVMLKIAREHTAEPQRLKA